MGEVESLRMSVNAINPQGGRLFRTCCNHKGKERQRVEKIGHGGEI
jgi:hypothetical protein